MAVRKKPAPPMTKNEAIIHQVLDAAKDAGFTTKQVRVILALAKLINM